MNNDEISLVQVVQIFTKRWKYLVVLALLFVLGALIKHKYFPMYPGYGKLIIKDVRNSQLQLVLSSVVNGIGEPVNEIRGEDDVQRAELILNTYGFYTQLAQRLIDFNTTSPNSSVSAYLKKFGDLKTIEAVDKLTNNLAGLLRFNAAKGGVLEIKSNTPNKELSYIIVNLALEQGKDNLINRELEDLNRAEEYFTLEINHARERLDSIEKSTVTKLQKNQILSVDVEKGDSSRYISELKKNINEIKISISNNKTKIRALSDKLAMDKASSLGTIGKFNETSQIKILEDENEQFGVELKTLENHLRTYENQKMGLVPMQYEIQKMNANHDFEYKMFASLSDSLAKIGLQKTYVKNKVDILERERLSRIYSSPSLSIMMLISILLSQVIGMFSIYVYELFRPTKL